ncbi:MAG: SDR family oxidoreductase [Phycisphaeraceae bacterium]|nr:SDR family oxidoreductase [Phycisphaerales bacterium]QOJ18093.1 MAG: SDR family oxidoreductase [Phycisphaeraceae bacterium]
MTIAPVALITGAGSGIGRATAIRLASHGWRLALVGRREEALQETIRLAASSAPGDLDFMLIPVDLSDVGAAEGVIDATLSQFKRLDALINNAGMGERVPIDATTPDLLDRTFALNTFAPAMLIAGAWKAWKRQRPLRGAPSPCVVNVSSMSTIDPFPGLMVYGGSKAALESFTRSIMNERGATGVRAFSIAPGAVETPLLRRVFSRKEAPPSIALEPDDVAVEIVACVLGDRPRSEGRVTMLVKGRPRRVV